MRNTKLQVSCRFFFERTLKYLVVSYRSRGAMCLCTCAAGKPALLHVSVGSLQRQRSSRWVVRPVEGDTATAWQRVSLYFWPEMESTYAGTGYGRRLYFVRQTYPVLGM